MPETNQPAQQDNSSSLSGMIGQGLTYGTVAAGAVALTGGALIARRAVKPQAVEAMLRKAEEAFETKAASHVFADFDKLVAEGKANAGDVKAAVTKISDSVYLPEETNALLQNIIGTDASVILDKKATDQIRQHLQNDFKQGIGVELGKHGKRYLPTEQDTVMYYGDGIKAELKSITDFDKALSEANEAASNLSGPVKTTALLAGVAGLAGAVGGAATAPLDQTASETRRDAALAEATYAAKVAAEGNKGMQAKLDEILKHQHDHTKSAGDKLAEILKHQQEHRSHADKRMQELHDRFNTPSGGAVVSK